MYSVNSGAKMPLLQPYVFSEFSPIFLVSGLISPMSHFPVLFVESNLELWTFFLKILIFLPCSDSVLKVRNPLYWECSSHFLH